MKCTTWQIYIIIGTFSPNGWQKHPVLLAQECIKLLFINTTHAVFKTPGAGVVQLDYHLMGIDQQSVGFLQQDTTVTHHGATPVGFPRLDLHSPGGLVMAIERGFHDIVELHTEIVKELHTQKPMLQIQSCVNVLCRSLNNQFTPPPVKNPWVST